MGILDEKLICLNVNVSSAEEAIKHMSGILLKNGYVKEGYEEKVIEREKIFPTGLKGKKLALAIPHTDPEYVIKPAVCVIVPQQKVSFGMMGGTPEQRVEAEVIMPLVISDSKKQIEILKKLMFLLEDGEALLKIKNSSSKEEIIQLLSYLEE